MSEPLTIAVPVDEWRQMNRDLGFAEGLLGGWLYAGTDTSRAREATERFLTRREATERFLTRREAR